MNDYREKKIAYHYGFDNQLRQLQEECAELIVAVNKLFRKIGYYSVKPPKSFLKKQWDNLVEELADVSLVLDQVVELMAVEKEVEQLRKEKVTRTLKRIEEEREANEYNEIKDFM